MRLDIQMKHAIVTALPEKDSSDAAANLFLDGKHHGSHGDSLQLTDYVQIGGIRPGHRKDAAQRRFEMVVALVDARF